MVAFSLFLTSFLALPLPCPPAGEDKVPPFPAWMVGKAGGGGGWEEREGVEKRGKEK